MTLDSGGARRGMGTSGARLKMPTRMDIYSGDYYISDNELWVAFQTLAARTGTELAGNIDGMDRLLNEIVIQKRWASASRFE